MTIHCAYDQLVRVMDLKSHPKNPNTHSAAQVAAIAAVIEGNGWRAPVTRLEPQRLHHARPRSPIVAIIAGPSCCGPPGEMTLGLALLAHGESILAFIIRGLRRNRSLKPQTTHFSTMKRS